MTQHSIKFSLNTLKVLAIVLIFMGVTCGLLLTPPVTIKVMAQQYPKPVAVIDGTFNVYINHTAYLDGTLSSGSGELEYNWTLESKPPESIAEIDDINDPQASLTPDIVGIYRVKLVVTSNLVDSDPAYANITVTKHPYMW
jgi:hypothetical protein